MATTPIFAQPTSDENLVPGWNVQGNNGGTSGNGYATHGVTGGVTEVGQLGSGIRQPLETGSSSAAAEALPVLENGSYSVEVATPANVTVAPTGALPTQIGVSFTVGTAITAGTVAFSGLPLVVMVASAAVTYTFAGASGSAAAGQTIPAGAVIVTAPASAVLVTAGL